jgi:hypothetical protein
MSYAPIILFVYNRPWHTRLTVEALKCNELAIDSDLYIFADAAKQQSDEEAVQSVRNYISTISGFRNIHIVERSTNMGLANSIIKGVTDIVNKLDRVIVLEDDIVASPGFLRYMNDALDLYFNEPQIGCIHAWNYNLNFINYNESTFFLRGADCWGWATWNRAWKHLNTDGSFLLKCIQEKKLEYEFNRKGTHDYVNMLKNQISGKNNSWAVRWHASLFIDNMFCLHPVKPIVKNIGLDNSGTHCETLDWEQQPVDYIVVDKIDVIEDELFFEIYRSSMEKNPRPTTIEKMKSALLGLIKKTGF